MVRGCFSWFRPLTSSEGKSPHHTMSFQRILCFQLCGNSFGKALSCSSTAVHRALTSTPSNTFGINCNTNCPISLMFLWLNGSKFPQKCSNIQWKDFPEECKLLQQQRGDQLNINAHDLGMRCSTSMFPPTFGHVVCIYINLTKVLHRALTNPVLVDRYSRLQLISPIPPNIFPRL